MADPVNCCPFDQILSLSTLADRTTRMAIMPVSPLQKPLAVLQPTIRHSPCLADRAAGVAVSGLSSLQDSFVLVGGLR